VKRNGTVHGGDDAVSRPPGGETVVLAGGVGAARMLRAMRLHDSTRNVAAIVNTGDDAVVNGLYVSPDVDTVIYTLADAIDPTRGWGLRDESWTTMASLARYAKSRPAGSVAPNDWFNLGDRDLATHLYRTARLAEGASASAVTGELARAWGVACRVVPMSDDRVATQVVLADDASLDGRVVYRAGETISFQEYFVRLRHAVAVRSVEFVGAATARANGLAALQHAERIVIAPSNPLVSIAPIRALRGVDEILTARRDDVVAVSPIIGGAAVKGPADRMLRELGHEATALGVARIYAEVCGTFVIDTIDATLAQDIEQLGMRCVVTNTIMNNDDASRHLAQITLSAAATTVKTTVGTARTATRRGGS
jgi:LPPG:FO 2-phospho-L-lactate transferase